MQEASNYQSKINKIEIEKRCFTIDYIVIDMFFSEFVLNHLHSSHKHRNKLYTTE